jgi:LmbE family N-acetylglucosaminyl deacetylase
VNPAVVHKLIHLRAREPLTLDAGPTIVFAPHKDDEAIGCGGMILRKRLAGAPVYLVFMTDGRASHRSEFVSPPELATLRTSEARASAQVMGIPQENLIFLEFEECRLRDHEAEAVRHVTRLLREIRPAEIFVPYHREAQADHGETHRIVERARAELAHRAVSYQYFVWTMRLWFWQIRELYRHARWHRLDVHDVLPRKKQAVEQYRSQTTALYPDKHWPVLPPDLRQWYTLPYEYFLQGT